MWFVFSLADGWRSRAHPEVEQALDNELKCRLLDRSVRALSNTFGSVLVLIGIDRNRLCYIFPITRIVYERLKQIGSDLRMEQVTNVRYSMLPLCTAASNHTSGIILDACDQFVKRILRSFKLHYSHIADTPEIVEPFFKLGISSDVQLRGLRR